MSVYDLHEHGIIRVKVPLPFPLQWVNSYVIRDQAGCVVIDPGLHTEAAERTWVGVLNKLDIRFDQIRSIVLTHHHPDHYGMAGWMQERTAAPVYMSQTGQALVRRMWSDQETMTEELCSLFATHGMPPHKQQEMREHMRSFIPLVSPQPEVSGIEAGETWQAGELSFETIAVSGHASGHLIFLDAQRQVMFCGDHVLPRITPNISYMPDEDPNPLQSFLDGLDKLGLHVGHVDRVYPGHRDPFSGLADRIRELKAHHEQRLQHMLKLLHDEPLCAHDVMIHMFGSRLGIHQLRFALSETLAHLIYLEKRGSATQRMSDDGQLLFTSVS